MKAALRRLRAPTFPDVEKTRIARFLNQILIAIAVMMAFDAILLFFTAPDTIPTMWLNGVTILVCVFNLWLIRVGGVQTASWILITPVIILTVYYIGISGGILSPAYQYLYSIICIATILFGARGALWFGIPLLVISLIMYVGSSQGWLISQEPPPTLSRVITTTTICLLLTIGVLYAGGIGIRDAVNRALRGERVIARRNEELKKRDKLVEAVSVACTQLLQSDDWETDIESVLRTLAEGAHVERAAILQFHNDGEKVYSRLRYEWTAAQETPLITIPDMQHIELAKYGLLDIYARLRQKMPTTYKLKDRAMEAHLPFVGERVGIATALHLPIIQHGVVWGSLYFGSHDEHYHWQESELKTLQLTADMLGAIIQRRQAEQTLQQYAEKLEQHVYERTAQLEEANRELVRLNRLKDEFVSNVSHELKTPITSLKIRHHMLSKQPHRLTDQLAVMERETDRLAGIIGDLLELSRMDQNRTVLQCLPLDLNTLITQFVEDRVPLADERGLTLIAKTIPNPVIVNADRGLIEQALSVLVTNALNYTPAPGTITISTFALAEVPESVGFAVCDTGMGIPLDEQSRLFTRFFRGSAGQNSGVSGTGLGLSIAHAIITQHKGTIRIESEGIEGKGTTFIVTLPADTTESIHPEKH